MRPFKFRLYDSWQDRMIIVIGFIFETPTQIRFWYKRNESIVNESIAASNADILQFTGIIDKNGEEVYEKDIVKYQHSEGSKEYKGKIFYKEDSAAFWIETGSDSGFALLGTAKIIEVVGSLYDYNFFIPDEDKQKGG